MNIDRNIEFRFCTKTLSEGHRVFYDDGREILSFTEEFDPVMRKAQTADDAERSAVIFEEDGRIYLAVFGLKRKDHDRAGRTIRFSFCRIYRKSEAGKAMNAFTRVCEEWRETEKKVDSLIEEIPVMRPPVVLENFTGKETPGEDVSFPSCEFLGWLEEKPAGYSLPQAGKILKYCYGEGVNTISSREPGESHTFRNMMMILFAGLAVMLAVMFWPSQQKFHGKLSLQRHGISTKPGKISLFYSQDRRPH